MQREIIPIDNEGMEILDYETPGFPCAVFFADIAKYLQGVVPWHWHEEVEVFVVLKGSLKIQVGSKTYVLHESDGAFINTNILHAKEVAEGNSCELITIVFSPSLFAGGKDTILYNEITAPIYRAKGSPIKVLSSAVPWEREVLSLTQSAGLAYQDNLFNNKLIMCENLSHIWRLLLNDSTKQNVTEISFNPLQDRRTQMMLTFIHKHYQEPISIQEIADSADISTRECSRCFQNVLHTSPAKYLMQYRISTGASLLLSTDYSVTDIAILVGFNSSSYFTKVFRSSLYMSPTKYRKLHKLKTENQ